MIRWRCMVCGYLHDGPQPPHQCPVCGAPAKMFEKVPAPEGSSEVQP
ncbi:MAG: hypothetical protein M0036_15120 [Desulfobacteraceae bacterium]|nr:hypothetical protein [Desulfobacteraceae bacterium]